ncbi:MAG: hypothetical protein DLM61_07805 [Pseudonocardiales bacterium]|nr:hypothetical protein [Pseudonocardiales bacterium]PZS31840.1 MAG: hypothetical protein DLM61_07805 [Pseudonocardiales bacterium]
MTGLAERCDTLLQTPAAHRQWVSTGETVEHTTGQTITILRNGSSASQPVMRAVAGDSSAGKTL